MDDSRDILSVLRRRPVILDGAMGTMIQNHDFEEADYRGARFAEFSSALIGNNDLLPLTQPAVIEEIHYQFLKAGADIIETCTFGANAISQADYQMQGLVAEMNREAVRLARSAVERIEREQPGRICYIAGAIGPTNKTASISPEVNDPGFRAIDFDGLSRIYCEQIEALMAAGVDLILIETVFDTLNAKAALYAAQECFDKAGRELPLMISATVTDNSGRTLSGQTVAAFYHSVKHAKLLSVGINCALGAADMFPYLETLHEIAECYVSVYANAGLPNAFGGYDDTPESMAAVYRRFASAGLCNIYGGCCGTTPEHIAAIAAAVREFPVRVPPVTEPLLVLTGLEPLAIRRESNFIMIGERNNVTGSRRFARLILEEHFDEAVAIARKQVEEGANIIDINMDEAMIDSRAMMVRFLNLLASEPDAARVPVAIDSSEWEVIEAALKCVQGRSIVNSISLKEGEEQFRAQALKIQRYGAVPIVMAFDEQGQADTTVRRVEICTRAYNILIQDLGYQPFDIIFDLNIFPVGTGMEEHRKNALSFIESISEIKLRLPGTLISGGVSNLSFSFRGNNAVREAMHSAFLYHAVAAGMDMGIVNAGMLEVYDEINPELLAHVEDVILDRRADATERLLDYAQGVRQVVKEGSQGEPAWRAQSLEERLSHALVKGIPDYVEEDLKEALEKYNSALEIIEGPLMQGMGQVGELFGAGKMFLPQVVKSARSMKRAVEILEPLIRSGPGAPLRKSGRVVFATVKGDVHDIGKNIVSVVLQCNNFEVFDAGVMVSKEAILEAAVEYSADLVAVSGLITPSLKEMERLAAEMQQRGLKIPLVVGGATTSPTHTAVKIAPLYDGVVAYARDASITVPLVRALVMGDTEFIVNLQQEQELMRQRFFASQAAVKIRSYGEAQRSALKADFSKKTQPHETGVFVETVPVRELIPYIDWTFFLLGWGVKNVSPRTLADPEHGAKAEELLADARAMLTTLVDNPALQPKTVYAILPAVAHGNDLLVKEKKLHFLRQQTGSSALCITDFVDGQSDHIGLFATTAGQGFVDAAAAFRAAGDDYSSMMVVMLANRMAEALAEYAHYKIRQKWGSTETLTPAEMLQQRYGGVRPAIGYPSWPDHSELATLFELMNVTAQIGVKYTESYMMLPESSTCGMVLAHPDARYFAVGKISLEQLEEYAQRKEITVEQAQELLSHNLSAHS
ncbi:MAG: methionine synthase [Kiritimatiellia bacterium]